MSNITLQSPYAHFSLPNICTVDAARPFRWLYLGGHDLLKSWPVSLGLGILFTFAGRYLVDWAWLRPYLGMVLTTGFLLVSPFLAIGFYAMSRRVEHNHRLPWSLIFSGIRRNAVSIGLYAVLLAFALSVWERLSAIIIGLFLFNGVIESGYFSLRVLFSPEHIGFDLVYTLFGAALAGCVFILSVVTLPMLMTHRIDTVTAIMINIRVVRENPIAMLVWAGIIATLGVIGIASSLYAFVIIFPLLGHATWHAYRDMVKGFEHHS